MLYNIWDNHDPLYILFLSGAVAALKQLICMLIAYLCTKNAINFVTIRNRGYFCETTSHKIELSPQHITTYRAGLFNR